MNFLRFMVCLSVFLVLQFSSSARAWQAVDVTMHPFDAKVAEGPPIDAVTFELKSEHEEFGGFSGAAWFKDRLYFVSDRGTLWRADAKFSAEGALEGLNNWFWSPVYEPDRERRLDLEALTLSPEGRLFTSVEGRHQIYEIVAQGAKLVIIPLDFPDILKPSPRNRGIESLATQDGQTFWAISEGLLRSDHGHAGVMATLAGDITRFSYPTAKRFDPTDLSIGPDGRLFVLERRYGLLSGWQSRIGELILDQAGNASRKPVLDLSPSLKLDNFEGLALRSTPSGTRALLISDDNYLILQSNLLFDLELPQ